MPGDFIADLGK